MVVEPLIRVFLDDAFGNITIFMSVSVIDHFQIVSIYHNSSAVIWLPAFFQYFGKPGISASPVKQPRQLVMISLMFDLPALADLLCNVRNNAEDLFALLDLFNF